MNIRLTEYIYPLKKEILLSEELNIRLDNPRTEKEVSVTTNLIKKSHEASEMFHVPPYTRDKKIMTWDFFLKEFFKKCSEDDSYVKSLQKSYRAKNMDDVYKFIASIWIIARYDDKGEEEEIRAETSKNTKPSIVLLEDDSPIIEKSGELVDYSYVVSLIMPPGKHFSYHSFMLHSSYPYMDSYGPLKYVSREVMYFGLIFSNYDRDKNMLFPYTRKKILKAAKELDNSIKLDKDKIRFIGRLLKIATFDTTDEKIKILILVSIIELLLTHNPNYSRFNVEDSISKQFILKTALVLYQGDKSLNLKEIKEKLKDIYDIRSKIAHGDLGDADKLINKYRIKFKQKFSDEIKIELIKYIRAILLRYVSDKEFIDFLKEN